MANGMWTAATGASTQAQNLDVIANNLANSDTPAFKKETPTFREYLATVERVHDTQDIPRGAFKDKDFYPLDGRDQSYVIMDGTPTNFQQGSLRVTQHQFDIALDGPGFLEVSTPNGIRYTRQGSLKLTPEGRLVTLEGYPVMANQPFGLALPPGAAPALLPQDALPNDPNVVARIINLKDKGTHFLINSQGEIYSEDNLIAKINVAEFQERQKLKKMGAHLYRNTDPANRTLLKTTQVHQGVLETSNVNPIEEMTNMIKANRLFEHDLKSLKTYGELLGKEANEVGKL